MSQFKSLTIVIPVFNEEKYIAKIINKVAATRTPQLKKEIIVVDDGSTDKSAAYIEVLMPRIKNSEIIFIKKAKNYGKGKAIKTALLKSKGDIVIIQDADLEYDPNNYSRLIEPFIKYQADVVYGSRFKSHRQHRAVYFWHFVGNLFLTALSNLLTNLSLTDMETGFKVFRGELIRKIAPQLQSARFGFEPEITARIARIKDLKLYEVGISYKGRSYNQGKKIDWRDGLLAIGQIIKYRFLA